MGNSQANIPEECFSKWHQDVTVSNNHTIARNYHDWCYNRTCYGSNEITLDKDLILRWVIAVEELKGYVCVGIDSSEQIDTWFYANKKQPNYGYESSGKIFQCGDTNQTTETYGSGDRVTMVLHTASGKMNFYKNEKQCKYSITIKPSKYRLSVSLKRAQVQIIDFSVVEDELQQKYRNVLKTNDELRQQIMLFDQKLQEIECKVEEKQMDECKNNNNDIVPSLRTQMKTFQKNYNEITLEKIFNEKESKVDDIISVYKNIQSIQQCVSDFNECIENAKSIINRISQPNELNYKNWNIHYMIVWIASLENGRYVKYLEKLKNGFVKAEIFKGEHLPDLDISTLSLAPFEINSFPDKRDLVNKFKTLRGIDQIEGNKQTMHH